MSTPPATPSERIAATIRCLGRALAAMSGGDRLSYALIGLIIDRLRGINQRVARLAARIRDGRYAPRRVTPHHRTAGPRRANPLPRTFGWLLPLVPDAFSYRSQLEFLFRDPDMAALLAAAPAALRRPLRSLCHMLGLRPPDILAPPAQPRPKAPKPEPRPARQRTPRPGRPRYVFGLRAPPPLPDPA